MPPRINPWSPDTSTWLATGPLTPSVSSPRPATGRHGCSATGSRARRGVALATTTRRRQRPGTRHAPTEGARDRGSRAHRPHSLRSACGRDITVLGRVLRRLRRSRSRSRGADRRDPRCPLRRGPAATSKAPSDTHEVLVTHSYPIAWLLRHAMDAPPVRWLGLDSANAALTLIEHPSSRAAGVAMAFKLIETARPADARSMRPTGPRWSAPARGSKTAGDDHCAARPPAHR